MSYNPYGGGSYGLPPAYGSFPGSTGAPGMVPPPGLGPPPGMSSAPGMAPAPGIQQSSIATQANRPSGLPASFQPPPNLANINFNAPVIRLGTTGPHTKLSPADDRRNLTPTSSGRAGLGMDRGDGARDRARENALNLVPPTSDERLRTICLLKIPEGIGGDEGVQQLLSTIGRLRRWDSARSHMEGSKGKLFGFAQYDDAESLATAIELLKDVEVPVARQTPSENSKDDDSFEGIEKVKLQVTMDESTVNYLASVQEGRGEEAVGAAQKRTEEAREALKSFVRGLFYPRKGGQEAELETSRMDGMNGADIEFLAIDKSQEDELADIPAEMREVVAAEIAAFRERSNQRDLERLRREEEFEEQERRRNGAPRPSRLDSPPSGGSSQIPLGPRMGHAPSGPRGQSKVEFVNGGSTNGQSFHREGDETDASDDEMYRRELARTKADEDQLYADAERKWVNRERQRTAALGREQERERDEKEGYSRRREEQLERERNWDDERESSRKTHARYRDHAAWVRKRIADRAEEEARDDVDRRAEEDERRKKEVEMERARGMADSFLQQQAEEMESQAEAVPAAPQRVTISFGAAARGAQAQRTGPRRRTIAEVEGLLDDEEAEQTPKRTLVPIKFDKTMTEEELKEAARALAQEIPSEKDGLWNWEVKWDYLDESIITGTLRQFVEKKMIEYLGVQEQFLVDVVEEHLRKHGKPGELVEELAEALDDEAEMLVKKLWRMLIYFTESEKRGLR